MAPRLVERPSQYDPDIGAEICNRLASGQTIVDICEDIEMPSITTLWRWQDLHVAFAEMCTRARERQADVHVAEIVSLADRCRIGEKVEVKTEGEAIMKRFIVPRDLGTELNIKTTTGKTSIIVTADMIDKEFEVYLGIPSITTKVMTADMVERTKLQIDARKWSASRTAPHKYGDRVAHQMLDEHGKPAKAGITVIIDGAPRQIE